MRVERCLEERARAMPNKVALISGEARLTYAELNDLADRLAHGLWERGVSRGDRVAIFLDNCPEAVIALYAVLKTGAVFSIVNATAKSDKLAEILNNSRAKALVTHARLLPVAAAALDNAPSVDVAIVAHMEGEPPIRGGVALADILSEEPAAPPEHSGIDIDLAMIIYTSGSTGVPKGVMITHQNISATAGSIAEYLENDEKDVVLCVLPISFGYGLYQILVSVMTGGTVVLEKGMAFPAVIVQKLKNENVTGFPLVPTIAAIFLQMKDLEPGSFPHLRYITNAAAAMPVPHIERLVDLFPTSKFYSMYGLTECMRGLYMPPDELIRRTDSVGRAIPNTEAYVVDEHGKRLGPGLVGELVIRGAHVMKGYWENEEETVKRLKPGENPWELVLHTGDLFRTDEEGYFYFVSRKDDIIKSRGEKVPPKEVENAIYMLEGVKEVAVVGVPDPILGMAIKAVVVPAEGAVLSDREIIGHCMRNLEDFMVPKHVEFRQELPKTDSGKIRRSQIQAEEIKAYEEAH